MRWRVLVCLLLLPYAAQAQVTVDAVSSAESAVPGTTTSHSHTIAADANLILINVCSRDAGLAIQPVTSVSVGGQAATRINRVQTSNNGISAELWQRISPLTGSQTVAVTNDAANERTVTTVISLKGVDTAAAFGTEVTASDPGTTDANVDVNGIGSRVNDLVVMGGCARVNTTTVAPDATVPVSVEQVERAHADSTALIGFLYSEDGVSPTVDMRADLTPSERWAAVGVSVQSVTVSGGLYRRRQ